VPREIVRRRDELAEVGREFDHMAERIAALIDSQKRLLADISHELRSPLARLAVALELARKSTNGRASGPLDRIEQEAERVNRLVGQLLTITRLESGAETVPPEMVVLDLGMPGMDGFEVARRLRALPGTTGTLLVALTGWAQEDDRRRCYEAGFDGHLPKPVEWDALRQFLAHPKLLRHRPAGS